MPRSLILTAAAVTVSLLGSAGTAAAAIVPDNYPTIQAAINAVLAGSLADGSTIEIRPGSYNEILTISTTAKSLTLHALNGAGTVTVNAAGKNRSVLIVLSATGAIVVDGLRFTGGVGDASGGTGGGITLAFSSPTFKNCAFDANSSLVNGGGGVLTTSNATFLNCTFTNNSAAQHGGGLVITTGSRPSFVGCTFQGNVSGTSSAVGSGGAIHSNDASPTLRQCTIVSNQSKFAGGGIFHLGIFGSANGIATLRVEASDVNGNTTSRANAGANPAEGGGIHIEDNAIGRIIRSRIRNNVANTGGGLNAYRARYEIDSSIIEGNHAPDAANVGGFGGGIQASSSNGALPLRQASTVILNDTVVRNNNSRFGGGIFVGGDFACAGQTCTDAAATKASLSLTGSLVDSNIASQQAGGINATRATVTVSGGLVSRNTNNTGDGWGGGFMLVHGTNATLTGTHVAANQASSLGGGIFADVNATLSVSGSSIYRNTAANGGAIYVGNAGANAGTIQTSALVDNSATTIFEACPASAPYLSYLNNTIVGNGTTAIYNTNCGPILTVAQLNALPSGRASGNTATLTLGTVQSLAYFAATPDFFPSVLAWSVIRATSVAIAPGVTIPNVDTGTVDVDGAATVNYSFSAGSALGAVGPIAGSASPPPLNAAPIPTITAPAPGATFAVGQTLTLTGSATDAEDGALGAGQLSWTVLLQPGNNVVFGPASGNNLSFVAPPPPNLAAAGSSFLEVRLTATDLQGTPGTASRNVNPRKVNLTFASLPSGLSVSLNGSAVVTPNTVVSWEGYTVVALAPFAQSPAATLYLFSSWDALLSNPNSFVTPASPATYTALYQASSDIGPLDFQPVTPCRLLDTRLAAGPHGGPPLAAGTARTFAAWNSCGIPTTARALSVNVTGTGATIVGHLRIHPADKLVPATSTINLVPGLNRANNTIIALGAAGDFTVRCVLASGQTDLIVDVNGYFE